MDELERRRRLARAVEELRRLPEPDPAARARLSEALARSRVEPAVRAWQRRPPRGPLAAAVAVVCAGAVLWAGLDARSQDVPVQFVYVAEWARSVSLAGDFNGWDASRTPLVRGEGGVWSVVLDLTPGTFHYSFVVDGAQWHGDPSAPTVSDDFGRPSSLVYVTPEL